MEPKCFQFCPFSHIEVMDGVPFLSVFFELFKNPGRNYFNALFPRSCVVFHLKVNFFIFKILSCPLKLLNLRPFGSNTNVSGPWRTGNGSWWFWLVFLALWGPRTPPPCAFPPKWLSAFCFFFVFVAHNLGLYFLKSILKNLLIDLNLKFYF